MSVDRCLLSVAKGLRPGENTSREDVPMANKPSYQDLGQRVKELENETAKDNQTEQELRYTQRDGEHIFQAIGHPTFILDPEHRVLAANHALVKLTGQSEEKLRGKKCYEIFHYSEAPPERCPMKRMLISRRFETAEMEVEALAGTFLVSCTPVVDETGRLKRVIHIATDVTEKKRAEEALRKARDKLEQRIEERTGELNVANEQLRQELEERKLAEEALRESEEKYRQIFTVESDAIMIFDAETLQFIDVNDSALSLYGYTKEEFVKLRQPDITAELKKSEASIKETLAGKLVRIPIRYHKKKDGSTFPVEISAGTFMLKNRKVLFGVIKDITEHKRVEEHVRALSQQLIKAQENERQRLSHKLHDLVGQDLSALKISLDTLFDDQPEIPPGTRQRVVELSRMFEGTIMTVRNMAYKLRPVGLKQIGLTETLRQHCEEFSTKNGIEVDFSCAGMEDLILDSDTRITLYRLIQEGLNNVKRHADASHVTIRLVASFPNVLLRIEDNGKGFDVQSRMVAAQNERRMGLRTMEERVTLVGGMMKIESRPEQGTKILIEVPCKGKNDGQ
jgi:PAS domain S-box-containing protein